MVGLLESVQSMQTCLELPNAKSKGCAHFNIGRCVHGCAGRRCLSSRTIDMVNHWRAKVSGWPGSEFLLMVGLRWWNSGNGGGKLGEQCLMFNVRLIGGRW